MVTCCPLCRLSSLPLPDSMAIISSLAKTRITRTSSKNIMPVLDTGHLLAGPCDMLDTEDGGGVRWTQGGRELQTEIKREPLRSWREGEAMTWPHASSVKSFSSVLALCPGQAVQVKLRAPLGDAPCCHQQPLWSAGLPRLAVQTDDLFWWVGGGLLRLILYSALHHHFELEIIRVQIRKNTLNIDC